MDRRTGYCNGGIVCGNGTLYQWSCIQLPVVSDICPCSGNNLSVYRLAYDAWYPNLIPNGMEQKGYAVSNTIYPLVIIAMSPAATFLYEKISMAHILSGCRYHDGICHRGEPDS